MPKIIRHALFDKVSRLQDLCQFRDDFALATGLTLDFVDDLGRSAGEAVAIAALCQAIQGSDAGQRLCRRAQTQLLAAAKDTDKPVCVTCDAGLDEAAVPVRISGIVVGYLRIAGIASRDLQSKLEVRRIEHLLCKAEIPQPKLIIEQSLLETRIVSPSLLQAYLRILDMAARQVARQMTAHLAGPLASLPRIVDRACKAIRRRALTEDLHLDDVARECGVSASHLSRIFHHAAGLTFREYVSRCRVEHAQHLLLTSNRPITQIAYESGFQSLSQFNRVFRKIYGKSPRQMRAGRLMP